jgi:superfamily II DNA or RNA helicase
VLPGRLAEHRQGQVAVPIDFGKLAGGEHPPLISPRAIFASLPGRAAGFGYLRDVQGQVLDAWAKRRTERDLLIKMNTGTGKTAVGMLILRSSLNEGRGPTLYVSPDNYLAGQVRQQVSAGLGIETVDDPECSAYLAGEAIAVVNIHKLINGKSVFGGPASSRARPLRIGTVVIDDAHAALATTDAQCTVRIPQDRAAYSCKASSSGTGAAAPGS